MAKPKPIVVFGEFCCTTNASSLEFDYIIIMSSFHIRCIVTWNREMHWNKPNAFSIYTDCLRFRQGNECDESRCDFLAAAFLRNATKSNPNNNGKLLYATVQNGITSI